MSELDVLMKAIWERDALRVREALQTATHLGQQRPENMPSPLLAAAYTRDSLVVAELVACVEPDIFEASALGDLDLVNSLLATQAGVMQARSGDGWTALHLAAFFGNGAVVARLLEAGASTAEQSRNKEANFPLHAAIAGAASESVVDAILAAGADVDAEASGGVRPLHLAASRGSRSLVEALIARGADPEAVTADGRTPAAIAAERGFPELQELLQRSSRIATRSD